MHDCNLKLDFTQDILTSAAALTEALAFAGKFEEARQVLREAWARRGKERNPWMVGGMLVWAERLSMSLPGTHSADMKPGPATAA